MMMKLVFIITCFCCVGAINTSAQTVTISQESFNKLVNAAEQLVEAKDAINKLLAERGASDAAIASALKTIEVDAEIGGLIKQIEEDAARTFLAITDAYHRQTPVYLNPTEGDK
jgi:hypothetical protein